MDYIKKLPLITGLLGALLVGFLNYTIGSKVQYAIMKMAISLIIFFILGCYAKHCIERLYKEVEAKIEQEEAEKNEAEEGTAEKDITQPKDMQGINIDYMAGKGEDEEFTPLNISQAIKQQIKS